MEKNKGQWIKMELKIIYNLIFFVFGILVGITCCFWVVIKKTSVEINKYHKEYQKYLHLFKLSVWWIKLKQKNVDIKKYFIDKKYNRIAIYGMGYLGQLFYEEIQSDEIRILYGIDRDCMYIYFPQLEIYTIEDELEKVDAIVVTALIDKTEIVDKLREKFKDEVEIISLEEVLYQI